MLAQASSDSEEAPIEVQAPVPVAKKKNGRKPAAKKTAGKRRGRAQKKQTVVVQPEDSDISSPIKKKGRGRAKKKNDADDDEFAFEDEAKGNYEKGSVCPRSTKRPSRRRRKVISYADIPSSDSEVPEFPVSDEESDFQ